MHKIWTFFGLILGMITSCVAHSEPYRGIHQAPPDPIKTVRYLLQRSEGNIDLATAKVTIDHLIDSSLDKSATLQIIDHMVEEIRRALRPGMSDQEKLVLLKNYLYEPGEWNDHRVFQFDYLFGKSASNTHNAARSNQLALEMKRLGISDTAVGRNILREHFDDVVKQEGNILRTFSNKHGNYEVRDSLLYGPSGKATRLESTFEIMSDGARRFVTTIPTR